MENKSNGLKIALTYIAIFLLVVLIAIPPIFRIAFSDNDKTAEGISKSIYKFLIEENIAEKINKKI